MSKQQNNPQSNTKKAPIYAHESPKTAKTKNFLLRTVPVYMFLLALIIPASITYFYLNRVAQNKTIDIPIYSDDKCDNNTKVFRDKDRSLVSPLLFVETESNNVLNPLKAKINHYLEEKKQENAYTSASIYVKDLDGGIYMDINPDSLYDPASIMKVPLLAIYIKQAESDPNLLKKKYLFTQKDKNKTIQTIKDKTLIDGKSYTVEELLYYMIVYSDNEAFWILCDNIDAGKFKELDAELSIPNNIDNIHYPSSEKHFIANVNSIAHYFNVLYNATYLDKTMSNYALNLLTKSTFREGLVKGIDPNITIAHKFGERTISYNNGGHLEQLQTEFHECGIVYLKDRPYILGVMTRGNESSKLQAMVGDISKIVYDEFSVN